MVFEMVASMAPRSGTGSSGSAASIGTKPSMRNTISHRYLCGIGALSFRSVESSRKSHQTTIRFTDELWARLEAAALELDVSVAQYLRDAARARLDASLPE